MPTTFYTEEELREAERISSEIAFKNGQRFERRAILERLKHGISNPKQKDWLPRVEELITSDK